MCLLAPCCRPSTTCVPPWRSLRRASTSLQCTSRPRRNPPLPRLAAAAARLAPLQRCTVCRHRCRRQRSRRPPLVHRCTPQRRASKAWAHPRRLGPPCVQLLRLLPLLPLLLQTAAIGGPRRYSTCCRACGLQPQGRHRRPHRCRQPSVGWQSWAMQVQRVACRVQPARLAAATANLSGSRSSARSCTGSRRPPQRVTAPAPCPTGA